MATSRRKRAKSKSPRAPGATAWSRALILLEEIRAQNRATIEALQASERRIRGDFEERFRSLEARVSALEMAVQLLSKTVAGQTEDLRLVRQDINGLKAIIERKAEADDVAKLEARVVALEGR